MMLSPLAIRLMIVGAIIASLLAGHELDKHRAVNRASAKAYAAGKNEVQAKWSEEKAVALKAALAAETAARAEEQRRIAAQLEIANETQRMVARNRAAADRLDAAAPGLRNAVTTLATGCLRAGHPEAANGSAPATSPGVVLADVLGEIDQRLRDMAEESDRRRTAGLACEQSADSMTTR